MEFPELLRKAREIRKLSQSELAEKAGLEQSAVSHFESGRRQPSFHNLRRLADALRVNADYLLGRESEVSAAGTADALYRNISQLTEDDRLLLEDVAKSMLDRQAKKTKKKKDGE